MEKGHGARLASLKPPAAGVRRSSRRAPSPPCSTNDTSTLGELSPFHSRQFPALVCPAAIRRLKLRLGPPWMLQRLVFVPRSNSQVPTKRALPCEHAHTRALVAAQHHGPHALAPLCYGRRRRRCSVAARWPKTEPLFSKHPVACTNPSNPKHTAFQSHKQSQPSGSIPLVSA